MYRLKYGIAEVFRWGSGGNHTRSLRSKFEKVLLSLKKKTKQTWESASKYSYYILLRFFTGSFYFLVRGDMFKPCFFTADHFFQLRTSRNTPDIL